MPKPPTNPIKGKWVTATKKRNKQNDFPNIFHISNATFEIKLLFIYNSLQKLSPRLKLQPFTHWGHSRMIMHTYINYCTVYPIRVLSLFANWPNIFVCKSQIASYFASSSSFCNFFFAREIIQQCTIFFAIHILLFRRLRNISVFNIRAGMRHHPLISFVETDEHSLIDVCRTSRRKSSDLNEICPHANYLGTGYGYFCVGHESQAHRKANEWSLISYGQLFRQNVRIEARHA